MGLGCSLVVEEVHSGSVTEVDEATVHKNLIEMKRHYYGGGLKSRRKGATIVTYRLYKLVQLLWQLVGPWG